MDEINLIFIYSILEAHGSMIESLKFTSSGAAPVQNSSAAYLIAIFECVPHLKTLNWSINNVKFTNWYTHEPILQELESLKFASNDDSIHFANMFTPNTIKTFGIDYISWKHLGPFVQRQSAIKNLSINHENLQDLNIFKNLQIDTLRFSSDGDDESRLYSFLRSHEEIKEIYCFTDKESQLERVQAFFGMKNLESIALIVTEEILEEIHELSNLPNMKEVYFDITGLNNNNNFEHDFDDFELLASIRLEKLESMAINNDRNIHIINSDFLETAGIHWPNLKKLNIDLQLPAKGGIDLLNEFLDNFPFLETLVLCYNEDEVFNDEINEDHSRKDLKFYFRFQQYPNMKNLHIHGTSLDQFQDIMIALPNLESFKITGYQSLGYFYYTPHNLHLLTKLEKLNELDIKFLVASYARLELQDVEALKLICRRLKTFSIIFDALDMFANSLQNHLLNFSHFIDMTRAWGHLNNRIYLKNVVY